MTTSNSSDEEALRRFATALSVACSDVRRGGWLFFPRSLVPSIDCLSIIH